MALLTPARALPSARLAKPTSYLPIVRPAALRRCIRAAGGREDAVVAVLDVMEVKHVAELTADNFEVFLDENKDSLMVVDYHTPLCGPCKMMGPVIDKMAQEFADVSFAKFDCSASRDNKELAVKAGVRALPTFHIYRGSQKLAALTGAKQEALRRLVRQYSTLEKVN